MKSKMPDWFVREHDKAVENIKIANDAEKCGFTRDQFIECSSKISQITGRSVSECADSLVSVCRAFDRASYKTQHASESFEEMRKTMLARAPFLCRWWLRTRPCKKAVQLNNYIPACVEFYVPWWAWPLELTHRLIFGTTKIQ